MKLKPLVLGVIVILLTAVWAYSAMESDGPDRLDTSAYDKVRRPGAVFSHDEHNEIAGLEDDCTVCHHVYEGNTLVEDESSEDSPCSECHSLKATDENTIPLTVAFHKRCKDCHFDANKGPVLCGECHTKE